MQETKKSLFSNRLSIFVLIGTIILLPLFFLPYVPVALGVAKGVFLAVGVIISFALWLVSRLIEGSFTISRNRIVLFAFIIPIVFFVSALFSKSYGNGLWGGGFDVGTVSMMISGALIVFLCSIYIQKVQAMGILLGSYIIGTIVLIFSIVKIIFSAQTLSFGGVLFGKTSNLIGSWSDLGLFAGLLLLVSIIMTQIIPMNRKVKISISILSIVPLIVLIAVNSMTAWILVGITTLLVFVYSLSFGAQNRGKMFPTKSFIVILISLLFVIANPIIGNIIPSYLGVGSSEVRPSVRSTFSVAHKVLYRDPVLGVGPNNFSDAWSLYKPQTINLTQFWNVPFNAGFGLVPTFLVTTGVLGALAWLLFIITFLFYVFRVIGKKMGENDNNLIFITAITSIYLLVAMFVAVPGIVLVALFFVFVGMFVGLMSTEQTVVSISFLDDPRKSFFSILGIVAVIALVFVLGFGYIKKFSGVVAVGLGINSPNTQAGITSAEKNLVRGASLSGDDVAYRTLSQFYLIRLGDLLSKTSSSEQSAIQPELQAILSKTESSSQAAISYNPNNTSSWLTLASVYDALLPLGIDKSYDNAKSAYQHALTLDPHNPLISLRLANLEIVNKNISGAREYIQTALLEKSNYVDAYVLLSEIEQQTGDGAKAIEQLQKAISVEPGNSDIAFRLGVAFYANGQHSEAVSAFERSVITNPNSLNARYYLGLAYNKVGRTGEAIAQLQIIQKQLPDNKDIASILEKIQSGVSLDAETPVVSESSDTLDSKKTDKSSQ